MQAFNPYLPGNDYVADCEPRVFGNRLYVYGSQDAFGGNGACTGNFVCWSAPLSDLGSWKYEGIIYKRAQDPYPQKPVPRDSRIPSIIMRLCAPDCVQGPDGRYYLYYQLLDRPHGQTCTCVAVADTPTGPFAYYGPVQHPDGTTWGEKKNDSLPFAPGVLVDEDGRAYLYAGLSPVDRGDKAILKLRGKRAEGAVCYELKPDMRTVRGGAHIIVPGAELAKGTGFDGHAFFTASSIRKINSKYYFVYSSVQRHELCYAVSEFPDCGFVYGGTLISNGDIGYKGNTTPKNYTGDIHGGMEKINGQWYVFYHRHTNRQKCARQGCAEPLTFDLDGSIKQAEMTSCGLNDGPLQGVGIYEARIACNLSARQGTISYVHTYEDDPQRLHPYFTQYKSDQYIANLRDGSTAGFKYFDLKALKKITLTVRGTSGVMELRTAEGGPIVAAIKTTRSGDWTQTSAALPPLNGVLPLFFTWRGAGCCDFRDFTLE